MHPYRRRLLIEEGKDVERMMEQDECPESLTGVHRWKKQTAIDEDRTKRHDWGLIIGTVCLYCGKIKG